MTAPEPLKVTQPTVEELNEYIEELYQALNDSQSLMVSLRHVIPSYKEELEEQIAANREVLGEDQT